jgi:hypothetical protein
MELSLLCIEVKNKIIETQRNRLLHTKTPGEIYFYL